ncbi:hypothetical protein [Oribacterium sp. P6A1]|uniref:hypothetical protein n=1 Tax=Oribacterium sp. P6A1 TaxID=1410612 RepID=UPI000566365E|nr:hypothetical protein [Oribacterium sp. P6A1]
MEFDYFYRGDLQKLKEIKINLNPLTDGFVENKFEEASIQTDLHALIIATNGEMRLTDYNEVKIILDGLKTCGAYLILGNSDFIVLFNDDKTFDLEDGKYFVGSMVVMKLNGQQLLMLSAEEILTVQRLLEGRMATLVSGEQRFSALVLN